MTLSRPPDTEEFIEILVKTLATDLETDIKNDEQIFE